MGDKHTEEASRLLFKNVSMRGGETGCRKGGELSHRNILTVITEEELQAQGYRRRQNKTTRFATEDGKLVNNLFLCCTPITFYQDNSDKNNSQLFFSFWTDYSISTKHTSKCFNTSPWSSQHLC